MKKMGRPTKAEMALKAKEKADLEILRRTGGRLKKAKKVFDPSENYVRKRRLGTGIEKDEITGINSIKDGTNPQEPYLKLQELDDLLNLKPVKMEEPGLNKSIEELNTLQQNYPVGLEKKITPKSSLEYDTDFTPDAMKVQKIKKRGRRRRKTIAFSTLSKKESDSEFVPNRIKKKKRKVKTFNDDLKQCLAEKIVKQSNTSSPFENIPEKLPRGRPVKKISNELVSICSICVQSSGVELITCSDCNIRAHISCIKTNFLNKKLLESNWYCDNCKTCEICYETFEIGALITCSGCTKSYHTSCHVPNINVNSIFDQANWVCTRCGANELPKKRCSPVLLLDRKLHDSIVIKQDCDEKLIPKAGIEIPTDKVNNENNIENTPLQISSEDMEVDSAIEPTLIKEEKINNKSVTENTIPDVSKWSCEKLTQFIGEIFPNEAHVFIDNEIDGGSLLLMTRSNVLNGLGLNLGPALRLYNFIVTLQTRKHDEFATWYY